jgi:hypothetical protein
MRKLVHLGMAAVMATLFIVPDVEALPLSGAAVVEQADSSSQDMVQEARVFCYNRYTGRFLHWGSCAPRRVVRRRSVPRVYCYNRRTGRFLHWGHC